MTNIRVAIADYDGTLKIGSRVGDETIREIERWRNAGNAFGIATGRARDMIVYETDKWGIAFDFLICDNGADIYDAELNLLRCVSIPDELVRAVLEHPAAHRSMHFELCSNGCVYLHILDEKSWFPQLGPSYTEISYDEALALKNLQQISFSFDTPEESYDVAKILCERFGKELAPQQNGRDLDIERRGVNKASGIAAALEILNLPERGLLVIGDAANDLPMIKAYGGYTLCHANDEIRRAAKRAFRDVGEMLRHAEKLNSTII